MISEQAVSSSSLTSLIKSLAHFVDQGTPISNNELIQLCRESNELGWDQDPHIYHEIAEVAVNSLIREKYGRSLLASLNPVDLVSLVLRPLQNRIPTQTWRSGNQITFQQFSTPASIAYLAAYLLNIEPGEIFLEPSCGTGSLAVWPAAAGAVVITNEIDPRRRELARALGFEPFTFNAEFIDDLLPLDLIPDVVLANPPFSSSGGKTKRNSINYGFYHIDSALRRLEKGGRFAVILGENGSPVSRQGRSFWEYLSPEIQVRASIALPGREFYRNGTNVETTLIVGTKTLEPYTTQPYGSSEAQHIIARSVEEAFEQSTELGIRF